MVIDIPTTQWVLSRSTSEIILDSGVSKEWPFFLALCKRDCQKIINAIFTLGKVPKIS